MTNGHDQSCEPDETPIRYAEGKTRHGPAFIAVSGENICGAEFGIGAGTALARRFPERTLIDESGDAKLAAMLADVFEGRNKAEGHALDLHGTDFQILVWKALRRIPRGETRSYSELAAMIGKPSATRAVARACAANPIAVIVPCHRVVRADGSLSGYRWGAELKQVLLDAEKAEA